MTTTKPEGFKYSKRQATLAEIESAGFKIEPETIVTDIAVQSPVTGAYYEVSDFMISASATIDDVQYFGKFLSLESNLPMSERFLQEIA